MGEVYLAEDQKLGRKIALKILPPKLASNPQRRARFEREAPARGIPSTTRTSSTVYSVEEERGVHFLTTELVEGKDALRADRAEGVRAGSYLRPGHSPGRRPERGARAAVSCTGI